MPSRNRTIRAVVFDLDDTLYGETQYVRGGYAAVAKRLRDGLGRQGDFETWLWDRFTHGPGATETPKSWTSGAFNDLNGHFGLGLSQEQILELVAAYRAHRPLLRPYEGVPELLGRLRENYRIGLLSDGFLPSQRLKFESLGVERFFDAVLFTEELGREFWKPSPAGFERVRDLLGVPHEACAYVGDNPVKDFVAPNMLGWLSIQYVHPGQVHGEKPAGEGGEPQTIVREPGTLCRALK